MFPVEDGASWRDCILMERDELLVCSCVCSSTLSYVAFFPLKSLRLQIPHLFQVRSSFQSRQRQRGGVRRWQCLGPGPEHRAALQACASGSLCTLPVDRRCWTKVQTPTPLRGFPPKSIPLLPSPSWTKVAGPGRAEASDACPWILGSSHHAGAH